MSTRSAVSRTSSMDVGCDSLFQRAGEAVHVSKSGTQSH